VQFELVQDHAGSLWSAEEERSDDGFRNRSRGYGLRINLPIFPLCASVRHRYSFSHYFLSKSRFAHLFLHNDKFRLACKRKSGIGERGNGAGPWECW